jgi:hypothetical protein
MRSILRRSLPGLIVVAGLLTMCLTVGADVIGPA